MALSTAVAYVATNIINDNLEDKNQLIADVGGYEAYCEQFVDEHAEQTPLVSVSFEEAVSECTTHVTDFFEKQNTISAQLRGLTFMSSIFAFFFAGSWQQHRKNHPFLNDLDPS